MGERKWAGKHVYDLSANEKMINYHKNWVVMWRALKGSWLYGIKLNPLQLCFNDITLRDTMTTAQNKFFNYRVSHSSLFHFYSKSWNILSKAIFKNSKKKSYMESFKIFFFSVESKYFYASGYFHFSVFREFPR